MLVFFCKVKARELPLQVKLYTDEGLQNNNSYPTLPNALYGYKRPDTSGRPQIICCRQL